MKKNYIYHWRTGVIRTKLVSTKKKIVGLGAAAALVGAFAVPTFAANDYCGTSPTAPGNGPSNGCAQSFSQTQCAGHGSFGAFGTDNNFAGGANGKLTGLNNSSLCGNPQGNP